MDSAQNTPVRKGKPLLHAFSPSGDVAASSAAAAASCVTCPPAEEVAAVSHSLLPISANNMSMNVSPTVPDRRRTTASQFAGTGRIGAVPSNPVEASPFLMQAMSPLISSSTNTSMSFDRTPAVDDGTLPPRLDH